MKDKRSSKDKIKAYKQKLKGFMNDYDNKEF